jgi:hypothetical protein
MCIWIFPIALSHFGGISWIFFGVWWVSQPFCFEKVVLYLVLWIINWWQSHLGPKLMVWRWYGENKMSKNECEFSYNQIRMKSISPKFRGPKIPLELVYSIMILNTISHQQWISWAPMMWESSQGDGGGVCMWFFTYNNKSIQRQPQTLNHALTFWCKLPNCFQLQKLCPLPALK